MNQCHISPELKEYFSKIPNDITFDQLWNHLYKSIPQSPKLILEYLKIGEQQFLENLKFSLNQRVLGVDVENSDKFERVETDEKRLTGKMDQEDSAYEHNSDDETEEEEDENNSAMDDSEDIEMEDFYYDEEPVYSELRANFLTRIFNKYVLDSYPRGGLEN